MDDVLTDSQQRILDAGFRYVSMRPRSRIELTQFLQKKIARTAQEQSSLLPNLLARLLRFGYGDDAVFVRWWVEQRNAHRPKGPRALEQELRQKGVALDTIRMVYKSLRLTEEDKTDELSLAQKSLKNRLDRWKSLPTLDQKKRIYGFLGRRGFSSGVIRSIVDSAVKNSYNTEEETGIQ